MLGGTKGISVAVRHCGYGFALGKIGERIKQRYQEASHSLDSMAKKNQEIPDAQARVLP
jgi:hypothetical protein